MKPRVKQTERYDFRTVENRWRPIWEAMDLYAAGNDPGKPDRYILDFFPYPSGDGLSVGHCRNYVPTCVDARFYRMRGYNVLHPMGWDAFGLPAENYAIEHGIHPSESSRRFSDTYRRQMKLVECSYDWSREFSSTDPDYYRWTQWFFLLLFRRGLAYQAFGQQWWCPHCQTILANEQVENGRCWRCDSPVTRKSLKQWFFRITDYADRLLADLDLVEWPERIKAMQRNWIGRSEGTEVVFSIEVDGESHTIPVFTTRPDTLLGVTFLALAPEHPLITDITNADQADEVRDYVSASQRLTEIDRMTADKEKTGVFTGAYAIHPLSGEGIPIWVADYVLPSYGSGAVMGVPAHDERDHAFAQRYGLPIKEVLIPSPDESEDGEKGCFTGKGMMVNSGSYTGLDSTTGAEKITADLEADGQGHATVNYRMRDWLISRQRYWGAPIPIIHCERCGVVPVPEEDLPVRLPEVGDDGQPVDFRPAGDGRSPLARVGWWLNVPCPQCGGPAQRETDTMDGFACSSWYFLRFASPHETDRPFDPDAVARWLPVDAYVGGAEHAVGHLMYSRFWTKVMADAGLIHFTEPFTQLRNQGMVLSPVDGKKMSKSKGNVITPDEVVAEHGTDALRAYLLFLGPFDAEVIWDDRGIVGVNRFLERFWKLAQDVAVQFESPGSTNVEFERVRHQTIRRVTHDMEQFRFNTAVAALMEYVNYLVRSRDAAIPGQQWRTAVETVTLLLAPIAPFITEEVWHEVLGGTDSVHRQSWPVFDESLAADEVVTIVVQVNGKLRDRMEVTSDITDDELRRIALSQPAVQAAIDGSVVENVVVVPGRLVNVVTGAQ
ncbi:MAG: leucine--tRNA ligase [Chloroflexota bacterium]